MKAVSWLSAGLAYTGVTQATPKPKDNATQLSQLLTNAIAPPRQLAVIDAEFQVNTYMTSDQSFPSITALPTGGFVIVWQSNGQDGDKYGIYAQRYTAAGTPISQAFRVNTHTPDDQSNPSITALPNGGFVVAWQSKDQDESDYGIYAQRYTADGAKAGNEFQVNTYIINEQSNPSITALPDSGFVVTWQGYGSGDGSGIYAQRYTAAGVKAGSEFRVNTHTDHYQIKPSITALSDGGFVVVWYSTGTYSHHSVYAQRYNATGDKISNEFQVNAHTSGVQSNPSIAALSDGGFIVVWASYDQDGSDYGLYAQRYYKDGAKAGDEFQVNTYMTRDPSFPSITALPDGGFVIAWQSKDQDGDTDGIYAQRYTAAGTPISAEFQVNTHTPDDQSNPSITALPTGGFVVAWQGNGQPDPSDDIYAKQYDCLGEPTTVAVSGCASENTIVHPIVVFRVTTALASTVALDLTIPDDALGQFTVPDAPATVAISDGIVRITGSRSDVNTLLSTITLQPNKQWQTDYYIPLNITVYAEGMIETKVSEKIAVFVENDAPTVQNPIPQQVIPVNQAWTFTVPDDVFSDVDDASLTLIAYELNGAFLTDGIQFDSASRTFTWTPTESSTRTIVLKATDSGGLHAYHQFILIAGSPPSSPTVLPDLSTSTSAIESTPLSPSSGEFITESSTTTTVSDGVTTPPTPDMATTAVRFQNPVPDITVSVGSPFAVQIPSDTFFDPNNDYTTDLFQIKSDGAVRPLPMGLDYNAFTGIVSGQLDDPVNLRLVLIATDPDRTDSVESNPFSLASVASTTDMPATTQVALVTTSTIPVAATVNWAMQAGVSLPLLVLALLNR